MIGDICGLTSVGSRIRPSAPLPPTDDTASSKKKSEWKISGRYWLTCTNRLEPVDATDYCFELHYTNSSPRQLFATFEFGSLKGMMRMCPENAIISRPDKALSLMDFEAACKLHGEDRPSPGSKQWLVCISCDSISPDAFLTSCETLGMMREPFLKTKC
jgi:hypothetical protein